MNLVKNQIESTIKTLRTDRGREYLSKQVKELCDEKEISSTINNSPNSVAKWCHGEKESYIIRNCYVNDGARQPLNILLGEALLIAAYILNCVPLKLVPSTFYKQWTGRKPNLDRLCPWGLAGYAHTTSHRNGKLGPRAHKCIFIRYSDESKGYVILGKHPDGSVTEIESRDADFLEGEFLRRGEVDKNLGCYEMNKP